MFKIHKKYGYVFMGISAVIAALMLITQKIYEIDFSNSSALLILIITSAIGRHARRHAY